jgi:hypothetical protein
MLDSDCKLSRLQNFTLDTAGPLVAALEQLKANDHPDQTSITSAIQQSMLFMVNANAQFSKERRLKALENVNPDLKAMAEEEEFAESHPYL